MCSTTSAQNIEIFENRKKWEEKFEWSEDIEFFNQNYFKNRNFRPFQKEAINAVLSEKNVLGCLPTGSGKSLIFQLSAKYSSGVSIVVCPLIALTFDQKRECEFWRINAEILKPDRKSQQILIEQIQNQEPGSPDSLKIIFTSPEVLMICRDFVRILNDEGLLDRLVLDEAHCLLTWSSFRKVYLDFHIFTEPGPFQVKQILLLTGTATPYIRSALIRQLRLKSVEMFTASHNRPNLFLQVLLKNDTKKVVAKMINIIESRFRGQSGIIYCKSKNNCEKVLKILKHSRSITSEVFHGGLKKNQKKNILNRWINGVTQVVVSTSAFGLGINKPDCRFVFHYDLSTSMESYYQQISRAGRDGIESLCLSFVKYTDLTSLGMILENSTKLKEFTRVYNYAIEELKCRRKMLLEFFGEQFDESQCQLCDNCLYKKINGNFCKKKKKYKETDLTEVALKLLFFTFEGDYNSEYQPRKKRSKILNY